jgi:hypothetical protein
MFLLYATKIPHASHAGCFSCILARSNASFGHFSSIFAFLFLATRLIGSPLSVFPSLLFSSEKVTPVGKVSLPEGAVGGRRDSRGVQGDEPVLSRRLDDHAHQRNGSRDLDRPSVQAGHGR